MIHRIPDPRTNKNLKTELDCIILCGGQSVRLWPLTMDTPKALLPIAGKPAIEYVLDFVQGSTAVTTTILSVNEKYVSKIQSFLDSYKPRIQQTQIQLKIDPIIKGKNKLGPLGALDYIITQSAPRDLLILGGDNLFGFQLDEFLQSCSTGKLSSYNAVYKNYEGNELSEYGTVGIDNRGNLFEFYEKPLHSKYNNISTACYLFREQDISLIHKYIEEKQDSDSIGSFIHWLLINRGSSIKSFNFSSFWFDIGTRESLLQANRHYMQHSIFGELLDTVYSQPVYIAAGAKVWKSNLDSFVFVGSDTQVKDSNLRNSIIMENCVIQESVITNSVISSGSRIVGQVLDTIVS